MRSKKAIYNIITNLLLQVVTIIYGFIVPKIIIDYFGSDANGLISSITQFLAYITLLESGFGPVVKATLYKPIAEKNQQAIASILRTTERFFRRIAAVFIVYILILCCIFPLIAKVDFDMVFTASLVVIIGISTFAEYFFGMTYRLFLQAEQKTYVISVIQVAAYILSAIAVVVLAVTGANILIIKLVSGLIFILRPLAQNFYVKKKYDIKLKNALKNYPIKQKWDGLAQHIAAVVHNNTDITVLTIFTTLAEVSVYSIYYLVVNGIKRIVQAFNNGLDASFGDMIAKGEEDNLRRKFSTYEVLYMMIITVVFACTFVLITPFVSVYTKGVTDADYIRPVFGYLLAFSEFVWAIRLPYNSLTLAAGHFRETRRGAWLEVIVNAVISVALVFKFGIIGVAVGTIVAMTIRTMEFVYHANRFILRRGLLDSVKKITPSIAVAVVAIITSNCIQVDVLGYLEWIRYAVVTFGIVLIFTTTAYLLFCRNETAVALSSFKKSIVMKGQKWKKE